MTIKQKIKSLFKRTTKSDYKALYEAEAEKALKCEMKYNTLMKNLNELVK